MATTSIPLSRSGANPVARPTAAIPLPLQALVVAVLLVTLGGQTDVAWHRSIGRDGFWIPPHLMVYACGLLAAIACGYLILSKKDPQNSVHLLGLQAPTGALLTAWGGLTMLFSAPFDNWWHNAYGLDVQVQSPPHIVLLTGTWAVCQGTLLLAAAQMNRQRAQGNDDPASTRIFLLVGALSVIHLMSYSMSYTFDTRLHQAKPYLVLCTGVPFALAALAETLRRNTTSALPAAPDHRFVANWTATTVASIYTAFMLALVWLLPLVPATPRLGPVLQPITHLIPPKFPILILIPALALDLLWQRTWHLSRTVVALLSGPLWLAALLAAEWPFATFLLSPRALGPLFATGPGFLDFGTSPLDPDALRIFENPQHGPHLWLTLTLAAAAATITIRAGQSFGQWMRQVVR